MQRGNGRREILAELRRRAFVLKKLFDTSDVPHVDHIHVVGQTRVEAIGPRNVEGAAGDQAEIRISDDVAVSVRDENP